MNKHAYSVFALQLIPSITLFRLGNVATGYRLKIAESSIQIADLNTFEWRTIDVSEKGDLRTSQQNEKYFETVRGRGYTSSSKMIQVNRTEIYVVGGRQGYPPLLARSFDVTKCCIKIDMETKEFVHLPDMTFGRYWFGLCHIGNLIFAIGGLS